MHEKYEVGYPQRRGGFVKRPRYAPGGANHNAFIVVVRPPGAYRGGVNENFSPVFEDLLGPLNMFMRVSSEI